MVSADPETLDQYVQRRLQESQDVMTLKSREEIDLANQVISTAEQRHGARSRERRAGRRSETRPHHVSDARRVATSVSRTGE